MFTSSEVHPHSAPQAPQSARRLKPSWRTLILLAILLLGAVLRFADLGQVRLTYDQAYPAYDAWRLLQGRERLSLGQPSSVFVDNPPGMAYLQALPLQLWPSPWSVYFLMVALNSLGIVFVYLCGRRCLSTTVGLLAAFLFATNPWIVYFSRMSWVQALLPVLLPLLAWGLWPATGDRRFSSRTVLVGLLALTVLTQTYVLAWGVLAQLAPLWIWFRRQLPRRALVIGGLVFLLAAATYGGALASRGSEAASKLGQFSSSAGLHVSSAGLEHAIRMVSGRDFESAHAPGAPAEYSARRVASLWIDRLLRLALFAGAVHGLLALRTPGPRRAIAGVLLVWFFLPILLTTFSSNPAHIHYLLLTCPAGHILAAWALEPIFEHNRWRWPALTLLLAIALIWTLNLQRANQTVAASPSAPQFDGWSLSAASRVGATIRELGQGLDAPLRLCTEGHAAILSAMSGRLCETEQELNFPNLTLLPGQQPLLYVLANAPMMPELLGPQAEFLPESDLRLVDGTTITFVRVPPYSREAALTLPDVVLDLPSESGLAFLGYSLVQSTDGSGSWVCTTHWRVDRLLPSRGEWYVGAFYHLLDAQGQFLANVSGQGRWAYQWRLGDVYISRVVLPPPAGTAVKPDRLIVGLFDSIHNVRYSVGAPDSSTGTVEIPVP